MYKLCPRCQQDKWCTYKESATIYNVYCSECHKFSYTMEHKEDGSKRLLMYSIATNLFKIDLDFGNKITFIFKDFYTDIILQFPSLIKINEHMSNEDINNKIKKYIIFT